MVAQAGAWIRMPTGLSGKPGQISGVAENADYTLTSTSELVTFCTAAKDEGDLFKAGDTRKGACRLQARVLGGGTGWSNLGTSSTVAGPYITPNTVCVHDEPVTSAMSVTTPPSSGISSGYIAAGRQHETANRLDMDVDCEDGWTEVHFSLGMGSATGTGVEYEFRARWFNDSNTQNAVQACTLTSPSAGTTTHSLADTASTVLIGTRPSNALTAVADLALSGADNVLVTTSASLTAVADLSLADTASPVSITTTASLTAVADLDLADTATPVTVTTTGSLTVVSELNLADTASPILVTTSGDLAAVQVHGLSGADNVLVTTSGTLTVASELSLADTASPVSVTTSGSLTVVSELGLADTATAVSVTTSGSLTAVQTHDLADTPGQCRIFTSGAITAVFAHPLADAATAVSVTTSGIISSTTQQSLSGSDSVLVSSSGILFTAQTHSLADTARTIDVHTSAAISASSTHNLVFGTGSAASTKVVVNTTGEISSSDPSLGHTEFLGDTAAPVAITTAGGISSVREHALSDNVLTQGVFVVSIGVRRTDITAVQDHGLEDTTIPPIAISSPTSTIKSFVVHDLTDQDNAPILVQPLTGFPYGPYISAATHISSVTITGIGDLDRSVDRGGVLHQRRNMFLKRSEYMAVEDVWNIGLTQLGVGLVSSQADGSAQAALLEQIWDGYRQQFISDHAWNGCKTTAVLAALEDSDFQDSTRWQNVFTLPDDYIRALTLNGHPNQPKSSESVAWEIEIVANSTGTKSRCLVTNQSTAKLEYVFDVGDAYIHLLSPAMRHAAGLGLAAFVGANFGKSASEIQIIEHKYREALLKAKGIDGQESSGKYFSPTELVDVRYRGG